MKDLLSNSTNKDGNSEIDTLFSRNEFDYAKPENLIKTIIDVATVEGDIVLDFFAGSGTTAAVAHKMGRRYIAIEQLDYISTITVPRLQKVIAGESGGVSEEVGWQGGGSFLYCELKERNAEMLTELLHMETKERVLSLLSKAIDRGSIKPAVIPDDLKEQWDEITGMSMEDLKRLVMELLDKNKLYVNLCDIEDEEMKVSPNEKAFTKRFYGLDLGMQQ